MRPLLNSFILALSLSGGLYPAAYAEQESEWDQAWGDSGWEEDWSGEANPEPAVPVHGFVEISQGWFTRYHKPIDRNQSLNELRGRLEWSGEPGGLDTRLKADIWHDEVLYQTRAQLREANIRFTPIESMDVVIGRQTQTWGTGDLVFLNDLFPKDWQSFFSGRDIEYLKKPGDAIRISQYNDWVNVDLSWSPVFDSDAHLTGERFSYFSPMRPGQVAAPLFKIKPDIPNRTRRNGEVALRLFRKINDWETALYGYHGFFKQPLGVSPLTFEPRFPEMRSIGASTRGSLWGGLLNLEVSHYDSREDRRGLNPLIPNDQNRYLVGYEMELFRNFTFAMQYYMEHTLDYRKQQSTAPVPSFNQSRKRHVITNRMNWRLMQQKLTLGLFTFYSTNEKDWFTLPSVEYRANDQWQFEVGARVFGGGDPWSFLGQHEPNSNVYARARYSF